MKKHIHAAQKLLYWSLAALFGIVVIGVLVIYCMPSPKRSSDVSVRMAPTQQALPQGKQIYSIATKGTGPKVTQAVIDPFDPKRGELQTIEVYAQYEKPIDDVRVTVVTDTASSTMILSHASGTLGRGMWRGTITTNDTHDIIYSALVRVRSGTTTTPVDISFR